MTRTRHRYGAHRSQVGDLWRMRDGAGKRPVVVLLHGGFWRFPYTKRLMNGLAAAIARRGLAAWNVEYRRVGMAGGGWPTTFEDVEGALGHLSRLEGLDLDRVITCGHSAGGHLALWLAARAGNKAGSPNPPDVRVKGVVSLAGVADLSAAAALGLGNGAVDRLLGGTVDEVPERYETCSPAALLPFGVPQVLVHGLADTVVPAAMSESYCDRAVAAGDEARGVFLEGVGHMELINPRSPAWATALAQLETLAW